MGCEHFLEVLRKMACNRVAILGQNGRFHNCNLLEIGVIAPNCTKLNFHTGRRPLHARATTCAAAGGPLCAGVTCRPKATQVCTELRSARCAGLRPGGAAHGPSDSSRGGARVF